MLKKTNDQLEQGLERQKQANLDGSMHRKADDGANKIENTLILEERVARAEQQMEKAQAERLLSIQEANSLKTDNQNLNHKISILSFENKRLTEQIQLNQIALKQVQELNNQNKNLANRNNELIEKINEMSQNQLVGEPSESILEIKAQLKTVE